MAKTAQPLVCGNCKETDNFSVTITCYMTALCDAVGNPTDIFEMGDSFGEEEYFCQTCKTIFEVRPIEESD